MPRSALLVPVLAIPVLLLGACSGSGFWRYEEDTLTLPGENPNMPAGAAENFQRARHGGAVAGPTPLLTEAGDIWPGPTAPVPTLKDLQQQQTAEVANGGAGSAGLKPLPPLPSLPGFEISSQQVTPPVPEQVFPAGAVPTHGGRVPIGADQGYKGGTAGGNIIVPNGNGTSTVISPTGQVTTIPTPK